MALNKSKNGILKESGTLNLKPKSITDGLFQENDFFDPHDLLQVKYEMLRRVLKEGWNVARAAREFGFSRPHFYELRSAFEKEGLYGLSPKKRGPKEAFKMTDEIMTFVEKKTVANPSIQVNELRELILETYSVEIHRTTLNRAIIRRKKKSK